MSRATAAAGLAAILAVSIACDQRPRPDGESTAPGGPEWKSLGPGVTTFRQARKDSSGTAVTWVVVRVDLVTARVRAMELAKRRLDAVTAYESALFAVNGGFFEPDFKPSGLLIQEGRTVSDWQDRAGAGALVVTGGRASIVAESPNGAANVELAVQCGPRLVEPGGALGMNGDDGKRAERTAACVRRQGRELNFVLAVSPTATGDGPTLFQLAQWLTQPLAPGETGGCEAALNLDGGPSTGVVSDAFSRQEIISPRGPVPWALVGTAR